MTPKTQKLILGVGIVCFAILGYRLVVDRDDRSPEQRAREQRLKSVLKMAADAAGETDKLMQAGKWNDARLSAKQTIAMIEAAGSSGLGDFSDEWWTDWKLAKAQYVTMIQHIEKGDFTAAEQSRRRARDAFDRPISSSIGFSD